MSLSNNPSYYSATVKPILDAALAQGGVRYTLPTEKKAIRWRFEAYHYRNLLHKGQSFGLPKNAPTVTEYDELTFTLEGNVVVIGRREQMGELTDLNGKPIDMEAAPSGSDLLDQVKQFSIRRLTE